MKIYISIGETKLNLITFSPVFFVLQDFFQIIRIILFKTEICALIIYF